MGAMDYLNELDVVAVRQTEPPLNRSRTGYGNKLGTSWEIQLRDLKWRRVYVIQWSNAGTAYIIVNKKNVYLGAFDPAYFASKRQHGSFNRWKR